MCAACLLHAGGFAPCMAPPRHPHCCCPCFVLPRCAAAPQVTPLSDMLLLSPGTLCLVRGVWLLITAAVQGRAVSSLVQARIMRGARHAGCLAPGIDLCCCSSGAYAQGCRAAAGQPASQPAGQPACRPACQQAKLPASLPASWPASQPAPPPPPRCMLVCTISHFLSPPPPTLPPLPSSPLPPPQNTPAPHAHALWPVGMLCRCSPFC